MSDIRERKYVLTMKHKRRGTVYWAGNIHSNTMVLPNEVPFLHLAARLTKSEAEDILNLYAQILMKQGWQLLEIDQ